MGTGAVRIPPDRVAAILASWLTGDAQTLGSRDALVILNIRLPRLLLGAMVGAGLAVAGALMQGLFRNPLADPGLVSVSAGARLAAAAAIVLGDRLLAGFIGKLPFAALPAGVINDELLGDVFGVSIRLRATPTDGAPFLLPQVHLRPGALAV
jgi:iron complex transport system permease protein